MAEQIRATIKAIKGTRDVLPGEAGVWQLVEESARDTFARYGYREIRTPVFEATELFQKTTGEETDIVVKEMYSFTDRGGRSITLRPEGTPGVVRAVLEHGLAGRGEVERLYYIGPMFRYERPQKGRFRQFSQIGIEVFGSSAPAVDVEVMQAALALFERLGVEGVSLQINSVGHPGCRGAYRQVLRAALLPRIDALCPDCRRRLDTNPLRILDCKVPGCAEARRAAPSILDHLCGDCAGHMTQVRRILGYLEVPYEVNPRLVRGLDYYTRTTFEITASGLGAQNALCGGGRYDDLVASMGGPPTPGCGFAIGADRLVMAVPASRAQTPGPDLFIVHLGEAALDEAVAAAAALRSRGVSVRLDPGAREMKKQMSRASASSARFALIIGDQELREGVYALKRLADQTQERVAARDWDALARRMRPVDPADPAGSFISRDR
ncbi:MAG TPA: histidine--tRNA ligase [Candidatus Polarisedimenticolia bacterium]|nr:histidine--tRNA ligase [Candidatus Polarisedimenticolia bacterium]